MAFRNVPTKILVAITFACALAPAVRAADLQYQDLPAAAKSYAENVRSSCKDYNPEGVPADKLAGITPVTLSDGTPALILDNESLCADHYTGTNCSNRGCDAVIMIQGDDGDKGWKEIFHEHLYEKTFNIDDKKLKSIEAWVYAGDPHCKTPPAPRLMSRDSRNIDIRYQNKRWIWRKLANDRPSAPAMAAQTAPAETPVEPAARQSASPMQAPLPPPATSGAVFQALPPEQQAKITQEADQVEKNCKSDATYSAYHDCSCIKTKFIERKSQQPARPKENVSFDIRKDCVNANGMATYNYDYCFKTASRMMAKDYSDERRAMYCNCFAREVGKKYSASPDPRYSTIRDIQAKALGSCLMK
jgi:hypothetical protein